MNYLNSNYYTYDNDGKYVHVLPVEECLNSLKQRIYDMEGIITSQKKTISEIDNHVDNDTRIVDLKKQINDQNKLIAQSFTVSDYEWKGIHKWQKEHDKKHGDYPTAGERYSYVFLPTGIGTFGTCRCGLCGEEFDFKQGE